MLLQKGWRARLRAAGRTLYGDVAGMQSLTSRQLCSLEISGRAGVHVPTLEQFLRQASFIMHPGGGCREQHLRLRAVASSHGEPVQMFVVGASCWNCSLRKFASSLGAMPRLCIWTQEAQESCAITAPLIHHDEPLAQRGGQGMHQLLDSLLHPQLCLSPACLLQVLLRLEFAEKHRCGGEEPLLRCWAPTLCQPAQVSILAMLCISRRPPHAWHDSLWELHDLKSLATSEKLAYRWETQPSQLSRACLLRTWFPLYREYKKGHCKELERRCPQQKYEPFGFCAAISFPFFWAASFGEFGSLSWQRWGRDLKTAGIHTRCCVFHALDLTHGVMRT